MCKRNFTYFVVRLQCTVTQMGCAPFASHHFQMGVTVMGFAEDLELSHAPAEFLAIFWAGVMTKVRTTDHGRTNIEV